MRRAAGTLAALAALAWAMAPAPPRAAAAAGDGIPRAVCGPGSAPETGVQGQIPRADRASGRSARGYRCNLSLIGSYQGEGASFVNPSYGHCAYLGSFFPGDLTTDHPGVQVIDASDPAHPRRTANLASPAFAAGTWESLKVSPVRGLLAATGVEATPGIGALTFDVYDIKTDCAHPRLLNALAGSLTVPALVGSHEGGFSPDGRTYYAASGVGGLVTAIDVTDPAHPHVLLTQSVATINHGFSISDDGKTMYAATIEPLGLLVLDISDVQARRADPQIRQVASLTWTDGGNPQMTIPFTSGGHKWLYVVDEAGTGGVRLVDIEDPRKPVIAREYRLEIDQPQNGSLRSQDTGGDGIFGYDAHYCAVDRQTDPTKLACGYYQSGVRVFDIHDPMHPRELAYYDPPAQTGAANIARLTNSAHATLVVAPPVVDPNDLNGLDVLTSGPPNMSTDWCTSPPAFVGVDQLWVTCDDNGFQALRLARPPALPRPAKPPVLRTGPSTRSSVPHGSLAATGGVAGVGFIALGLTCGAWVLRRTARPHQHEETA